MFYPTVAVFWRGKGVRRQRLGAWRPGVRLGLGGINGRDLGANARVGAGARPARLHLRDSGCVIRALIRWGQNG